MRLVSAEEAVSISLKSGTVETLSIVHEVAMEYKNKAPVYGDQQFDTACMLAAVWEAGRIQGIREERQKRLKKAG